MKQNIDGIRRPRGQCGVTPWKAIRPAAVAQLADVAEYTVACGGHPLRVETAQQASKSHKTAGFSRLAGNLTTRHPPDFVAKVANWQVKHYAAVAPSAAVATIDAVAFDVVIGPPSCLSPHTSPFLPCLRRR